MNPARLGAFIRSIRISKKMTQQSLAEALHVTDKAMQIIQEDSGSRFDPAIADAFCWAGEEVRRIMNSLPDS